ncbi:hypothetical protein [Mariprofundus erugo]|nr:hypothetical protein [Mariprofundus erugo]
MSKLMQALFVCFAMMLLPSVSCAATAGTQAQTETTAEAVMQQFNDDDEVSPQRKIDTQRKHQILFMMGIALLVLLLTTGILGISMVFFDKDVFLAHMIFAGLSLTLAAAHAATSIAWFWPY